MSSPLILSSLHSHTQTRAGWLAGWLFFAYPAWTSTASSRAAKFFTMHDIFASDRATSPRNHGCLSAVYLTPSFPFSYVTCKHLATFLISLIFDCCCCRRSVRILQEFAAPEKVYKEVFITTTLRLYSMFAFFFYLTIVFHYWQGSLNLIECLIRVGKKYQQFK